MIDQLEKNKTFYAKLQQTKKLALMHEDEVYGLLSATYLQDKQHFKHRTTKKERRGGEKFVVGLFFADPNSTLEDANITLNNQPPIKIKKLDNDHKLLQNLPLKNSWATYYMMKFQYSKKKVVTLRFEVEGIGAQEKKFYKVSRYLLEPN